LRVLIVTDAWKPQVNGVVRTLDTLRPPAHKFRNEVRYITPDMSRNFPMPTYPEIKLAIAPNRKIRAHHQHVRARRHPHCDRRPAWLAGAPLCVRRDHPFTSSFHTGFRNIEHPHGHSGQLGYRWLRWFHGPASALMVKTDSLKAELEAQGL